MTRRQARRRRSPGPTAAVVSAVTLLSLGLGAWLLWKPDSDRFRGTTYYVNCSGGSDSNSGTSERDPWASVEKASSVSFEPGDSLLLKRGSRCRGQLWPRGSGSLDAPITLADYASGPLPVIDGGTNESALKLFDQSFWEVKNIETTGGSPYGVLVGGNTSNTVLRHIFLVNLAVHDVTGLPASKKEGLISFFTSGEGQRFEDILVDGAIAYNTTRWGGINIMGATWPEHASGPTRTARMFAQASVRGANITVRNSIVHDVGGDGIVIQSTTGALIERSIAYETGQTRVTGIGTPNAIWNWNCVRCVVQFNEAYLSHSPEDKDGGLFDSDFLNTDVTIQYNYGHDADGYCIGVFGVNAPGTNVGTVVRYNICSNNGRRRASARQGDVYYVTWDGGTISNSRIYNNTIYWNPEDLAAPVVQVKGDFEPGSTNYFVNNILYSAVPAMIEHSSPRGRELTSDHNVFWTLGSTPTWSANDVNYTSLAAWQRATGMDRSSVVADPRLAEPTYSGTGMPSSAFRLMPVSPAIRAGRSLVDDHDEGGTQDFFGNALGHAGSVDIGAHQLEGIPRASRMP